MGRIWILLRACERRHDDRCRRNENAQVGEKNGGRQQRCALSFRWLFQNLNEMNALQRHDQDQMAEVAWLLGVDEAGRGALAGPVVAGACVLGRGFFDQVEAVELSAAINDSKQLSAQGRARQLVVIEALKGQGLLDFEVASGSVEEIAEHNILGATRLAMRRAIEALAVRAKGWELPCLLESDPLFRACAGDAAAAQPKVLVIVDGRPLKPFPYVHTGLVKGDGKSLAIAMASIAAKVTRDREMLRLADVYPEYDFAQHKGYGTATHRAAIHAHGASVIHRELFLRKVLGAAKTEV